MVKQLRIFFQSTTSPINMIKSHKKYLGDCVLDILMRTKVYKEIPSVIALLNSHSDLLFTLPPQNLSDWIKYNVKNRLYFCQKLIKIEEFSLKYKPVFAVKRGWGPPSVCKSLGLTLEKMFKTISVKWILETIDYLTQQANFRLKCQNLS